MQIYEKCDDFELEAPSAVAIGKFDGIHVGHQKLLNRIVEQKNKGLQAVVFTFDPSPATFFSGKQLPELTTKEEKRAYFAELGIDILIEFPLTAAHAAISPEKFIEQILVKQLKTAFIAAGTDLSYGDRGAGDITLLKERAGIYGYEVEEIEKVRFEDTVVSSSLVREQVALGHMEEVEKLLGMPYSIAGVVEHGKRLGRTLGMPTVNLLPVKDKLLPPFGVYFSQVIVGERTYKGITNIGKKPTVSDTDQVGVETYLYDFAQDIYGQPIVVQLFSHKRPEMKFDGIEALKNQMGKDIAEGRYYKH